MNCLRRWIGTIGISLLATSCATENQYVPEMWSTGPAEEMGTVVGSIGLKRKVKFYQRYALRVRPVGRHDRLAFYLNDQHNIPPKPDFIDNGADVFLFASPLRAGQYEIWNYEYGAPRVLPFRVQDEYLDHNFSLRFEVKPGQVTYLGQFVVVPQLGKPVWGTPTFLGYFWEIGDRQQRDLAKARERMPDRKFDAVLRAIPDPSTGGDKYLVKEGGTPPDWPIGPAE